MGQISRPNPIAPRQEILLANTPYYFKVKLSSGLINAIQVQWHDATSSFSITPYSSLVEDPDVPATAAAGPDLLFWHDESADISFTGAVASAAGCDVVHIGNNGAKWILLKFDVAANSDITILAHGKE